MSLMERRLMIKKILYLLKDLITRTGELLLLSNRRVSGVVNED